MTDHHVDLEKLTDVIPGPAGASLWADAIQLQIARIEQAQTELIANAHKGPLLMFEPARRHLDADVHFLVVAIRNLLRAQEAVCAIVNDKQLAAARAEFDAAIPHAWDFRDFLEHLDAYMLGQGNWQKRDRMDPHSWAYPFIVLEGDQPDDEINLRIADFALPLKAAAREALKLLEPYQEAISKAFASAPRSQTVG